jgi:long-chain acyl-CoA synthetase
MQKENIRNLIQLLDDSAFLFPRKVALIFGTKKVTYSELADFSKKLALSLSKLGVGEFDKVALWLPNFPEFVYSFFAVLRLRAIVVPINSMFKREEARFIVEDCCAKVLICSIDKVEDSENILLRSNCLKQIICFPAPEGKQIVLDFNKLLEDSEFKEIININENDFAEIVYTSGTTGHPKGACLSHKNLVSNIKDCAQIIRFSRKDRLLCILPLFHSFSSTVCMLLPLYKGATIVIMRSVRPFKRVIRAISKHRITVFVGVPSVFSILNEIKISPLRLLFNIFVNPIRLCISGAAALPLSVWQNFEKKFRRRLLQGYGLTEASPVVSLNPPRDRRKPDSIGVVLPSVKVKVVDKNDNELAPDKIGELLVKGPNVMQGYYNLEEETRKVLKNGWLYTGDLARIDAEGFIYIMGRIKEMINVRGFNVYPCEIEDLLYKYPKVKEAAVVGVPHKHRGEVPVAFVAAECLVDERQILNYLRTNLASYKVPLKILLRDSLPKNSTGKILKRQLQEEIKEIFA